MSRLHAHPESHLMERIGWLRAAVLGANDGIVSTLRAWRGLSLVQCGWPPGNTYL